MKTKVLVLAAALSVTTGVRAVPLTQAEITAVFNDVKVLPDGATPRHASLHDAIAGRTGVKTGIDSRAELTFNDQSLARLGANSLFSFNNNTRDLTLSDGTILFRCPKNAGGAKITTAAVTAAITGTTVLMETNRNPKNKKRNYIKLIVLEGTMRVFLNNRTGESVLIHAGQMIILSPDSKVLPEPVNIDLARLVKSSKLITSFRPLPSTDLVQREIGRQLHERSNGDLIETNLSIQGSTLILPDITDSIRNATGTFPTPTPTPTPAPHFADATPTPTPASKFGALSTIPGDYVADDSTLIVTDPVITTKGDQKLGKVYRSTAQDGTPTSYLFGATSAFDKASGADARFGRDGYMQNGTPHDVAVFKFNHLSIEGSPTFDAVTGPTDVALVSVADLNGKFGSINLEDNGLTQLELISQDGSVTLDSEFSLTTTTGHIALYACGTSSDINIDGIVRVGTPANPAGDALSVRATHNVDINGTVIAPGGAITAGNQYHQGIAADVEVGSIQAGQSIAAESDIHASGLLSAPTISGSRGVSAGLILGNSITVGGALTTTTGGIERLLITTNTTGLGTPPAVGTIPAGGVTFTTNTSWDTIRVGSIHTAGNINWSGKPGKSGGNLMLFTSSLTLDSKAGAGVPSIQLMGGNALAGVAAGGGGTLITNLTGNFTLNAGGSIHAENGLDLAGSGLSPGAGGNVTISAAGRITLNGGQISVSRSSAQSGGTILLESNLTSGIGIAMNGSILSAPGVDNESTVNGITLQSAGSTIDLASGQITTAGAITLDNSFGLIRLRGTTLSAPQINIASQQLSLGHNYTFSTSQQAYLTIDTGGFAANGFDLLNATNINVKGDISAHNLSVYQSLTGANITANKLTAGSLTASGLLTAADVTLSSDGSAGTLAVQDLTMSGVLTIGSGGVVRADSTTTDPSMFHIFSVGTIHSSGGINFQGGINALGQGTGGGWLSLNVNNSAGMEFGSTGVFGANFNGGDASAANPGGNGGNLQVTAAGDILVNDPIQATTGADGSTGMLSGSGGSVALTSTGGQVAVSSNILVSSNDPLPTGSPTPAPKVRRSSQGGNVTLKTLRTSGAGITINNTSQILALLNAAGTIGGKIEFISAGANILISGSGSGGTGVIQADKGTILIHNDGALTTSGSTANSGVVHLNGAILNADIIKVGALGVDGQLIITAGSRLTAGSLLNLYAGNGQSGHNDLVHFTGNGTITLTGNQINIGAGTVTVDAGTTVANNATRTDIYSNNHNYNTNVTAGGGGFTGSANAHPLSQRPAF